MAAVTSCENILLRFRVDANSFERGEKTSLVKQKGYAQVEAQSKRRPLIRSTDSYYSGGPRSYSIFSQEGRGDRKAPPPPI